MKTRIAVGLVVAALALAVSGLAQESPEESASVTGTVVSWTDDEIVIRTEAGQEEAYVVDLQTSLPPEALGAGTRITVDYDRLEDSRNQATRVTVLEPAREETAAAGGGASDSETLPQTASPVPLLALIGLLALSGGAALRLASLTR